MSDTDQRDVTAQPLRRLGIVMEPDAGDPREAEGVLNPAAARGPDGQLYLLPRLVAAGNYSRIGLARVRFDRDGTPVGVDRRGVILEPRAPYERNPLTGGGVEDPRITPLPARGQYVMTYTAYGPAGPRIAAALSHDLTSWRRLGLVRFAPHQGRDLGAIDNKDALIFPEPVPDPDGRPALALIHRPAALALPPPAHPAEAPGFGEQDLGRPSMWLSYAPLAELGTRSRLIFGQHQLLAAPAQDWERLKVGGGTPPLRLGDRWLVLYHGVSGCIDEGLDRQRHAHYSAGALLLDAHDPRRVLSRSAGTLLEPQMDAEREGVVPEVVFPTGLDQGADGQMDVYYGMADSRIGVARGSLGDHLWTAGAA